MDPAGGPGGPVDDDEGLTGPSGRLERRRNVPGRWHRSQRARSKLQVQGHRGVRDRRRHRERGDAGARRGALGAAGAGVAGRLHHGVAWKDTSMVLLIYSVLQIDRHSFQYIFSEVLFFYLFGDHYRS